jgi:hypothetical protein
LFARELCAKAKEILLSNAKTRIKKAKESNEKDKARDKVLQQASDPSKFEETIAYDRYAIKTRGAKAPYTEIALGLLCV